MKYYYLTFVLFQILFDHWGTDSVVSKVIFYSFLFAWVGVGALLEIRKGRDTVLFLVIALIMFYTSILFLTWINKDVTTFAMMTGGPPIYLLTVIVVGSFLWLIASKSSLWNGLKTTLNKRS